MIAGWATGRPLAEAGQLFKTMAMRYIPSWTQSEGRTSAGSPSWTDYAVEADVEIVDFNGSTRTYVTGRYLNGNNFYAASLYNSSGGTLEIRKKISGSTTTLAEQNEFWPSNRYMV